MASKKTRTRIAAQMVKTLAHMNRRMEVETLLSRSETEAVDANATSFRLTWTRPGISAIAGPSAALAADGTAMGYLF